MTAEHDEGAARYQVPPRVTAAKKPALCRCGHEDYEHDLGAAYGKECLRGGCPCRAFHKPATKPRGKPE